MLGIKLEVVSDELYKMVMGKLIDYNIPSDLSCMVMNTVMARIMEDALIQSSRQAVELENETMELKKAAKEQEGEEHG